MKLFCAAGGIQISIKSKKKTQQSIIYTTKVSSLITLIKYLQTWQVFLKDEFRICDGEGGGRNKETSSGRMGSGQKAR